MTDINKIKRDTPLKDVITKLQENDEIILGVAESDLINNYELQDLFSGTRQTSRFIKNLYLGNTLTTYNLFSGLSNEAGYTIWRYPVSNFVDNSVNAMYLDDMKLDYRGAATSETATSFSSILLLSGTTYTDDTTEAGTDNGVDFRLMNHNSESLLIGDTNTFNGIDFNFATLGYGYGLHAYYFSGTWAELTSTRNGLIDDTSSFTSNGRISFTIPSDWISGTFNGQNKRWLKLTTDTTPVSTATSYYIRPDDSVKNLLSLSSDDILDGNWAWCYYNNNAYVTLKNRGGLGYEGNEWLRIESSDTNKQNFFVYNHTLNTSYQKADWTQTVSNMVGNYAYQQKTSRMTISGTGANPPVICLLSGTVDVTNANRVVIQPYAASYNSNPAIFIVKRDSTVLYSGTYVAANILPFSPTVVDTTMDSGNKLYSLNVQVFSTGSNTNIIDFGILSVQVIK